MKIVSMLNDWNDDACLIDEFDKTDVLELKGEGCGEEIKVASSSHPSPLQLFNSPFFSLNFTIKYFRPLSTALDFFHFNPFPLPITSTSFKYILFV